ncbi:MAG TPA: GNAT family N-acetyltransferase [Syntrophorhabdaceae bacterium]|nr:GNAT family N-acetyltransferase [Syntrophorhabdaceae bacterium]
MNISVFHDRIEDPLADKNNIIFYHNIWLEILRKSLGYKQLSYIFEEGGKRLFISGSIINLGWFKIFYSNLPYGGFWGDYSFFEKALNYLEKELKSQGIDRIYITRNFLNPFPDLNGFKKEFAYQTVLFFDKEGMDAYKKACKYKINTQVRRAKREGLEIKEVSGKQDLDNYYNMYEQTIRRNQGKVYWNKKFFKLITEMIPDRYSILYAMYDQEPTAGIMLIKSKDIVHYFIGASDDRYLLKRPNDFILYHAIEKTISEGFSSFDFMLTDSSDKNLLWFKEKWGSKTFLFDKFQKDISHPMKSRVFDSFYRIYSSETVKRLVSWFMQR